MKNTLIIIPAYNVEEQLRSLLPQLSKYKNNCLIVDDGSTDGTNKVINHEGFNFVSMQKNSGVSSAIVAGLGYAVKKEYENVILMDADGQHDPKDLDKFFEALLDFDMVFANRFESMMLVPTCKIISNAFASMLYNDISGCYIPDVACGYKAFKISKDLYNYLQSSDGYSIIYRLVNYAILKKTPICFIPTKAIYYEDNLLFTRTCELVSLFSSVIELNGDLMISKSIPPKIYNVLNCIATKSDFDIMLSKARFYAFYLHKYDGYIIQSSMKDVDSYYKMR